MRAAAQACLRKGRLNARPESRDIGARTHERVRELRRRHLLMRRNGCVPRVDFGIGDLDPGVPGLAHVALLEAQLHDHVLTPGALCVMNSANLIRLSISSAVTDSSSAATAPMPRSDRPR